MERANEIHEQQEGQECESLVTPRIYVASLSGYNAGKLHGVWLDANDDITVGRGERGVFVFEGTVR